MGRKITDKKAQVAASKESDLPDVEKGRIEQYKEKQRREVPRFSGALLSKEDKHSLSFEFKDEGLTHEEKDDILQSTICAITGSSNMDYGRMLIAEALTAHFRKKDADNPTLMDAFNSAMLAMDPQDPIEAMLISKMLVMHNQLMHFASKTVANDGNPQVQERHVNNTAKLSRLFNESLEALNKYKRKGEQRVTVQHVNVNDGGRAIVAGEMKQGGVGSGSKK